jgi:MFS family permease
METKKRSQGQHFKFFRNVFFNLSAFQFLTFVRRGIFYSFMIDYLYKLMGTVTLTAALGTLNMIASSLGQNLLWGKLCDRYKDRTKLIIAGETIAASFYIAVFFIHKSLVEAGNGFSAGLAIIFGLSVLEFFWSMSDVGWAALLTDVTTPVVRGRVIGTLNFIASLGRTAGITIAGFLYNDGGGFSNGTIFYTVTALLFVGSGIMMLTSWRTKTRKVSRGEGITGENAGLEKTSSGENEKKYKWFLISLIVIVLGAASINQIILLFMALPSGLHVIGPDKSLILDAWTIGGMIASLGSGRLADKIGRGKILLFGLLLAIVTPSLYVWASNVPLMTLVYGLNGVSFWTIQTVGFVLAGDMTLEHKRGRLLSRYNTVMALSWGPAGFLIGGPLADFQVNNLGLPTYTAYANTFYVSSIMVALGTIVFIAKVMRHKTKKGTQLLN